MRTQSLLGLSNAGIRILRITYLFKVVPNAVIGRTGSIFMVLNVFMRMVFLFGFAAPFFTRDANVIYALMILGIFNAVGAIILLAFYRKLIDTPKVEWED